MALFLSTLTFKDASALSCPDKSNAPLCPKSGTTLLDETYPTQSFLISNAPFIPTKEGKGVTQKFVSKIIESYDYENVPQIMISVGDKNEFKGFVENTQKLLAEKNIPKDKIEKIISQISFVPEKNYTWQQDWFESFVDLKTGSPVVRQIESYPRVTYNNGQAVSDAGSKCGIENGEMIKDDQASMGYDPRDNNKSYGSGEMGGNIEGAPGGFCMVGDNQGTKFTKQFCGDKDNIIQLETSWLAVGHVDEIFKIIPTQYNDGRPKECEFSLMAASPKKALELMKTAELGKAPFMEVTGPDGDPNETRTTRTNASLGGNYYICNYALDIMKNRPAIINQQPAVKGVFLKLMFGSLSFAQDFNIKSMISPELQNDKDFNNFNSACEKNLDQVSNYEIQAMMAQDEAFMNLNNAIDASIEADKAKIKKKVLSRLPQCASYYNEMDVPNIFYGDNPVQTKDGKTVLPKPGNVNSFLPNPTNSVLMNKTVTFPDSGNPAFNRYVTEELAKRKMKSDFISTWDYAHLGKGNIHCSSHSLPYCRPNTKGSK